MLGLLAKAVQTLKGHSAKSDYQQTCGGMAVRSILDAVRSVERMADRETRMYNASPENGPGVGWPNGPRRFRVKVKLKRPAIWREGTDEESDFSPEDIKRWERAKFYDYGSAAAAEARNMSMYIGKFIESVQVYDRLEHVLWTYDGEGDTAELDLGPE